MKALRIYSYSTEDDSPLEKGQMKIIFLPPLQQSVETPVLGAETFHSCAIDKRVINLPSLCSPLPNHFEKFRLSLTEIVTKVKKILFLSHIITNYHYTSSSAHISNFSSMIALIGFVLGQ